MELFDSGGKKISLGTKVGTGGEGAVYEVPALGHELVAKVYHDPISPERQAKLREMVKGCDEPLKKIAAWPTGTLHLGAGGSLRGFLMPKLTGYEPIHHLYGPSHRKQRFPNADWAFLVNAARNVAAAFETIHGHGHVIGDVNPNVVFVAPNSIVKLIDCDSFQVAGNERHYLCEVGVPHFTPPELQGLSSFRGVRRTANHDNFGLALLLFHILLMGRHPFSGVFAGSGDMPLEKSIAEYRYAFGRYRAARQMSPPPNSIAPDILLPDASQLFERAFNDRGANANGRPTAREWISVLDSMKSQLRTCGQESIHRYFGGLTKCPWCTHEEISGLAFFVSLVSHTIGESAFNLQQVWARITAVASPGAAPVVEFEKLTATPKPLPSELRDARLGAAFRKVAAVIIVVAWMSVFPRTAWIALIIGAVLFFSGADDSAERAVRRQGLALAKQDWTATEARWQFEAGEGRFQEKLKELMALRTEYEGFANQFAQEKQRLHDNLRQSQMHAFLDQYFVEDASISGIGDTRKSILVSFGIETAADVSWNKVITIRGFGEKLTREVVDWRKQLERRFTFDPTKGVDAKDVAALNHRFSLKRKQVEGALRAGAEQLNRIRHDALQRRQLEWNGLVAAAQQVVQAEADIRVLG